jgi:hypothetical protein
MTIEVRALDPEGRRSVAVQQRRVDWTLSRPGGARIDVLTLLELPPGRYRIRSGVHSGLLAKSGSVYEDVVVPDFSRVPLSLSGVVLTAGVTSAAASEDAVTKLLPLLPTTAREFATSDRVSGFLRVYQSSRVQPKSATVSLSVRDVSDAVVFDALETIEAARFQQGNTADYKFELPLMRLRPGPHLLTIHVTLGNLTSERHVRFVVR